MTDSSDIGLIGLAVMGQNLVLNMNDRGYSVSVYNRTTSKMEDFLAGPAAGRESIRGFSGLDDFVVSLKKPRRIMLMVKAGPVVDTFIESLLPHLEKDDIIVDGGNSHFPDTSRRTASLAEKGILFVGTGVSGGEEGARHGPSLMPGGNPDAWPHMKEILQSIAARTPDGDPCCDWVGENGAGHYVKMVHNGIEYGDMQLIGEAYHLMHVALEMSHEEMHETFAAWNGTELNSFLIEITRDIMAHKDEDGSPLLERILDAAGQKGTGKWTAVNALDLGVPVTLIAEAVFARALSAHKDDRVAASKRLSGPVARFDGDKAAFVEDIRRALLASKIISYAQGFMQMQESTAAYGWSLNYGSIANMWRGGCIIRSAFLGDIKKAYDRNADLRSLLLDEFFGNLIDECQPAWRRVVAKSAEMGIPVPAFATALAFYDAYRSERLPANLIQAQRDYFGAHTYERIDRKRGEFFHTNWTGRGGEVSATTYNA
ncbi:MAG: decarboxylating NADP(+)-dependent phosphogluconate dehydrogenase [Spirochaetaceae bacterium]